MENSENHASLLPQPRRQQSPRKFGDFPASAQNVRNGTSMAPPPSNPRKHQISSLPESVSKQRKTLVERGGESNNTPAAPPSSRPVNATVKATAIAGPPRLNSYSSSVSSRTASSNARQPSAASFSASVGSGIRPPSAQSLSRAGTAMSNYRSASKAITGRPATALGGRDGSFPKIEKGMIPIPLNRHSLSLNMPKRRGSPGPLTKDPGIWLGSRSKLPSSARVDRNFRDCSLSSAFGQLRLGSSSSTEEPLKDPCPSPSKLPRPITPAPSHTIPSTPYPNRTPKSRQKSPSKMLPFLTRDSRTQDWDQQAHQDNLERMFTELNQKVSSNMEASSTMKEAITVYKTKINELEECRTQLNERNSELRAELDRTRLDLVSSDRELKDLRRDHEIELDELGRSQRNEIETVRFESRKEVESLRTEHWEEFREVRRRLEDEIEKERSQRIQAVNQASTQGAQERQKAHTELEDRDREIRSLREDIDRLKASIQKELDINSELRRDLSSVSSNNSAMDTSNQALKAKIEYLESDSKSQSEAYAMMERQMREAIERAQELQDKLRAEETIRRKLHNQVQELKGNIRVFCRVRPILDTDAQDEKARILFPDANGDGKDIEVKGPEEKSSLGTDMTRTNSFSFDRVFGPTCQNQHVFDELSQLVQSALDGYNVCIFCYGQTGSGKTYTMSSEDGMIPRAVHQIYETAKSLEERGWIYQMEGSFIEVYNENLNDLLGHPDEFDNKKHEIRHDIANSKTTVTDIQTVRLDSPEKVESMLAKAVANRSVAATKSNERSSRSHSVFMLRLQGRNSVTGDTCDATLNLVDLAGSERLNASKAEGARLKETQSINRSLSCLGDVIGALGQKKENSHIPYRNSKLTYLLQMSLSGHSKTLMFVMASPLLGHLKETIASLRFAHTVNQTHVGTARKMIKS